MGIIKKEHNMDDLMFYRLYSLGLSQMPLHPSLQRSSMAPIRYLDTPTFPADTPMGHPHLLDLTDLKSASFSYKLHLADLIVTLLNQHHPATLQKFLNLKNNFVFNDTNQDRRIPSILIIRKGKTVKCGYGTMKGIFIQGWLTRHVYSVEKTVTNKWLPISYTIGTLAGKEEDAVLEEGNAFVADFLRNHDLTGRYSGNVVVRTGYFIFGS